MGAPGTYVKIKQMLVGMCSISGALQWMNNFKHYKGGRREEGKKEKGKKGLIEVYRLISLYRKGITQKRKKRKKRKKSKKRKKRKKKKKKES
ncbi:hypothetical protein POVWA2_042160 [Plasmodium ovale wallikeri]|uniref:Uncharacterized protein n=1 Tax=Plasmodium ovale wallikeri TaxID=864142 RepID=A0A1A8ZCP9_PLAOA|nr:hypothetical protein POVWA1_043690 [Plasmodium ovale wallikeri]SBT41605.1 hypothetical protein POVWA2_042160 [Plasmodium ovale wallikeri]